MKIKILEISVLLSLLFIFEASEKTEKDEHAFNEEIRLKEKGINTMESSSNRPTAIEITESGTIPDLNFNIQQEYGYYYNLTFFEYKEDAVLRIVLKSPLDLSTANFLFKAKILNVGIFDRNLDQYIPQEDAISDFTFFQEKDQFFTLYFAQNKDLQSGTAPVIFFLIKLTKLPIAPTTAEIKKIRLEKTIEVTFNNWIIRPVSENFPLLLKFKIKDLNAVVYSDTTFNILRPNTSQELVSLSRTNQVNFHAIFNGMILEVYSRSESSATFIYNITNYIYYQADLKDNEELSSYEFYSTGNYVQYVLSTKSITKKENKWIYFKQEIGTSLALTYTFFNTIENNLPLLFPTVKFSINEPIRLQSNYYIIRPVTHFHTLYSFGSVEKVGTIIIEDKGKASYTHILDKGNTIIELNALTGRKLQVTLVQMKPEGNNDVTISVNTETKVVNNKGNKVARFLNVQATTMTINSPFQYLIVEFKLGHRETYTEIIGDGEYQAKYAYYKFATEQKENFIFEFNYPVADIKYNIGFGDEDFLSLPIFTFFLPMNSIALLGNPYNSNQPLASNEFFYVSFKIPDSITSYTMKIEMSDRMALIPVQVSNRGVIANALYLSKDKEKTRLIIALLQCSLSQYILNLFFMEERKTSLLYYRGKSDKKLEVISFPNNYISLYFVFNEGKRDSCSISYNYLNANDAEPFNNLATTDKLMFKFDKDSTKITWDNPNNVFSEFYVYIGNEYDDLSNECILQTKDIFLTVNKAEFVVKDHIKEYRIFTINVLGISKKNLEFEYAYKEKKFYYYRIYPISPTGKPTEIDFNDPPYGLYIKLDHYKYNEEGMLMVSFDAELDAEFINDLIFVGTLSVIGVDEDITSHIPTSESQSNFKYEIVQKKYIKMYIKYFIRNKNADTQAILGIKLKLNNQRAIKARISQIKVYSSSVVVGHNHIYRQFVDIQENVPFLFKIQRIKTHLYENLLFFSEPEVSLYKDSLMKSNGEINDKETVLMKMFKSSSSDVYIAEYFGPARKAYFYFEKVNDTVTLISSTNITLLYKNKCKQDFIGKTEYFIGSFTDITDYNQYYLYTKQDYGLVNAYYTNVIDIKGIEKSILPNDSTGAFAGVSDMKSPHFILRLDCKYPGDGSTQLLKPSLNIILEDNANDDNKAVHVLTKGDHKVRLKDLTDKSIEVNLIQMKLSSNNNILVNVGSNQGTLSNSKKVIRFSKVKEAELTISNPSDYIVVEFKINLETLVKVAGDRTEQTAQYIYYQLAKDRSPDYVYEFDREITEEITYTLSKGTNDFKVRPVKNITAYTEDRISFSVPNPYSTYNELESDEFWYVSIRMPDDITFHELLVKGNNDPISPLITQNTLNHLRAPRNSIEMNQDKSSSNLVIFLAQCSRIDFESKIYYHDTVVYSQAKESMRQLISVNNDHVPLKIEYSHSETSTSDLNWYYLSYNYMSQIDADKIKSAINTVYTISFDGNSKLTWNLPNITSRVKLFIIPYNSIDKVSNECEMLNLNKGIIVSGKEYNLSEKKDLVSGSYTVNILIESEEKLHYAIAYKEITINYKLEGESSSFSNNTWVWVGVSVGIIVLVGLGIGFFYWRRNKNLRSNTKISQLVDF